MKLIELYELANDTAKQAREEGLTEPQVEAARQSVFDDYRKENRIGYANQWKPSVPSPSDEFPP